MQGHLMQYALVSLIIIISKKVNKQVNFSTRVGIIVDRKTY